LRKSVKRAHDKTKTMKTIVIGIVAMLGVTGALHAQKGERKGGDGQLFSKLDTDGDGVVSKQEWEANWSGKGNRNRGQEGAKGRKGHGARGAQNDQQAGPGKGKGRPGPGGAGRGAGGARGAQDGQQAGPGKGKGRPGPGGAGRGAGGGKGGAR